MRLSPILVAEDARIAALAEYDLIDSAPASAFTQIVVLAARLFQVPTAFVSLLDRDRQVFHAKVGMSLCETSREVAFCSHTIAQTDALVVLDATLDPRFHDNPLVTGPPHIRFYTGIPLHAPSGHAIGTLCLADTQPRNSFSDADRQILDDTEFRWVEDALTGRSYATWQTSLSTAWSFVGWKLPSARANRASSRSHRPLRTASFARTQQAISLSGIPPPSRCSGTAPLRLSGSPSI